MPDDTAIRISEVADRHIIVQFGRPGRIEVGVTNGQIIAHIYSGTEIEAEQMPIIVFDSTLGIDEPVAV